MKFAIYLPNYGPFGNARLLADLAQEAEQAGWDGFFVWDHITNPWSLPAVDPWVALAVIACQTKHMRIGTTVTPLPRRRPWKVARETVSIDHLSGGRLILGVGTGGGEVEWGNLGEESHLPARGAMLDEALEILVRLWSGEPIQFTGKHYRVQGAHFLPGPLQSPRIPIWVGGFWPHKAPFRRAARWDGVFPLFQAESEEQELAQLKELLAYVKAQRTNEGAFDIVCVGSTPGDDPAQAARFIQPRRALGMTWWLECIAPFNFGAGFEEPWPLEAMRNRILDGPPRTE